MMNMKPAVLIMAFLTMFSFAGAQSRQQQKVDSVFRLVKRYFNQKNADAIYNLTGDAFQQQLGIDAFHNVAQKELFPLGNIQGSSLISFVNNSLGTYKLAFASGTLQMLISLDEKNKINLLLFQPYIEPARNKLILASTTNPMKTATDKKVDSAARRYIQKSNTVGLCIGVIDRGVTSTYGYGETVKGNHKIPDADNFFELGSITKTFTAILLAYYADAGQLHLNDLAVKYLPDSVAANPELQQITLLELINHTSGLERIPDNLINHASDPLNPYKDYSINLLMSYLKSCKLQSKPGERYAYSNLGVGLLGVILENITHEPFERMVHDVICKPLGMSATSQHLNPLMTPLFTQPYNIKGEPTPAWDFDVLAACGALRSTLHDMLIYAKANLQPADDALGKAIALSHRVTFSKDVKVAMGWHIITVNGVDYIFHNGGTNGGSSFLAFNPQKGIAVIVLSNAYESTDTVGTAIIRAIQ